MSATAAKRYAKAIYEVAKEQDRLGQVEEELTAVRQAIRDSEELRRVIEHPRTSASDKKALFDKLFKDRLSTEVRNFLCLLVDQKREDELEAIVREYVLLANDARGIVDATVTTAKPLSDDEKESLSKTFGELLNKQLRVNSKVDESIIGGVIVRIGDRLYDGSIAGKLARFQQYIKQS